MRKYTKNTRYDKEYLTEDDKYWYYWYDHNYDYEYENEMHSIYENAEGMDWYLENKEILERNKNINEILGIEEDNDISFNPLNF